MFESVDGSDLARNVGLYLVGVALAVAGALGIAEAIELAMPIAGGLFIIGLAVVLAVHEYFGGIV